MPEGVLRPMSHVLFVTPHYRPELIGSGPYCADIAEWLARQGRSVHVLTTWPHYPMPSAFAGYRAGRAREDTIDRVRLTRLATWAPRRRSALARIVSEAQFFLAGV